MQQAARLPEMAAAKALSKATFSLMDHSMAVFNWAAFENRVTSGRISELGVPGYEVMIWHPASSSPRAMAPFPSKNASFIPSSSAK
jgi:hypothetical protein